MKALSLKQPWAELIFQGKKKIELRKWNTNFRGEFFVHASKIPDFKAMKRFGFSDEDKLPLGKIIGKANLVDVKHYLDRQNFEKDSSLHLATTDWGDYGFILKDAKRLENPIQAKGFLNFWDFEGKL